MKKLFHKLPPRLRNKYVLTSLAFVVWMAFFDDNDFFRQYKVIQRLHEINAQKAENEKLISETRESLLQLYDKKQLERFAREQYLFRKNNEEIFVIIGEQE